MSWGDQYTAATDKYKALPFNQQAALSGFNNGGTDESGQPIWTRQSGDNIGQNSDAGESADQYVRSNTKFDTKKFFDELGVIPLDPKVGLGFDEMNAHSYKFANLDTMLKHMTGPGQYVDDPTLGKVWVPQNRNSQSWDINFIGAQGRGGGLSGMINNFADAGGFVKMLGMAILSPAMSDVFGNLTAPPVTSGELAGPMLDNTLPSGMDIAGNSIANSTPLPPPTPIDTLSNFVKDTFSPDNLLKQSIKQGVSTVLSAAMPTPAHSGVTSPGAGATSTSSKPSAPAAPATPDSGGIINSGVGIDPSGAGLQRLNGDDVFTGAGGLAIKGRGIIGDAIQP